MSMGAQYHYHVDLFEARDGKYYFVGDFGSFPKKAALREFNRWIAELKKQVGSFVVVKAGIDENFPGAIRVAINHRVALAVTRCDCGGEG